ncbi:hypothetical protein FOPG_18067 [Fusarium oxysporum f. sp. conglutinans race 2 54008]|uniref:BZIP domain-containing protein n=3 Tax=Fusarium oxysporum f. sp. conglutinans TaxID=100902 RepID=A0A8H6GED9_FUSOX|nr:hypothetical protein FOXB_03357 [Fusarium oxysporum f. sp. conglutinans Fo5176]EXL65713.1 hypothetical protein FOPG_18067 [Fusarium oxysporum f. sp. conglutinans race 2 54008]KAF6515850.1 hypothetical protein HZS61_004591 [Fusarium oxysporum f. sp. conglutinans]KAH7190695.1 hypothetical protein BKA60DRAFT_547780 [Fusarium oxysporum]KAG6979784.1 hypothetical protein FocnCong_v010342 [Fusarium oxysporum f. sp. conglutinans]
MIRSSSIEPAKPKQKGTRRVSTLTPAQLARKRTNDREAQRAIRTRTKAHIKRLERELAEFKSNQDRDQTIQELLRRNKAIEKELIRLKEIMGAPMATLSSPAPGLTPRQLLFPDKPSTSTVCNGSLSTGSDAIPSPRGEPLPGDYNCLHDYSQQYIPLSNNCESLVSTISYPILSNISTASSSGDDSAGYIPTSVPTPALSSNNTSSSSIWATYNTDVIKMEYIEVGHHGAIPQALRQPDMKYGEEISHIKYLDASFRVNNPPFHPSIPHSHPYALHHQQQQSACNM